MEFNRGAVAGWAGGVCGGAAALAAVFATLTGRGWHIAVFVLAGIAGFALVLLIGTGIQPASEWLTGMRRHRQQRQQEPRPLVTDRWQYSPAAFDIGTLANLGNKAFSHHSYMQSSENQPPAVRVGAFVACGPLADDEPTAEHLRSLMRDCLRQPTVMELIATLTDVDADAAWHSQPGRGRFNLEADLLGAAGTGGILASALLLLPEQGIMRYGKDRAGAELYLHVDLPVKDGVPVRVRLAEWYNRFTAALAVPGLLARFLDGAGLTASGDPATRFAVQIRARATATAGLDEIVDFGDLAVLSPRKYSMQFDGWAIADQQGKAASAISRRFLTELCECTGRTGYEDILAELAGNEQQRGSLGPDRPDRASRAARVGGWPVTVAAVIAAILAGFLVYSTNRTAVPPHRPGRPAATSSSGAATGPPSTVPRPIGPVTVYVANSGLFGNPPGQTVTPIDAATNTAGKAIPVGRHPQDIVITPDGKTAYVANSGSDTVTPISTATNTPGQAIPAGKWPLDIAITPGGKTAYITNLDSGTVTPISTATNTPGPAIPVGVHPSTMVITPDGKTVYVANGDGTVTPISTATNTPGPAIPVKGIPGAMAITPDGKTVYVVNSDRGHGDSDQHGHEHGRPGHPGRERAR